ncbi:type II secretion system F family protein [Vibrio parahaemolyticus]|uniref:type II secretion system F family protein n=1 Tax=Vibrio parahaemolyticus TaxID=670 RepID=UPI001120B612|nr:type II secretion system F family protein [Vibrio parahaemolyticus]EIV8655824.1 type II secretion system F family protein [Vibrio parahaemolyticus]MUT55313.1 type II secretion system protein F [Vibrio parahaemolyticus]TOF08990.1 type II secretion system protein F [Vibrio parahaemolyticus]TPA27696.1 type II secretion system protein F [Vibrio parahaemolyticus]HCG7951467.1 type II secretion system F family protein [Vibrio parahaemolyticus]
MLWFSLILFAFVLLLIRDSKIKKVNQFFNIEEVEAKSFNAINVKSLVRKQNWQRFKESVLPTLMVLGPRSSLYIAIYITGSVIASWYIVIELLLIQNTWLVLGSSMVFILCGYRLLVTRRRREFENTFPDALNILMSGVSVGDSLMQAISYVGDVMHNPIGREFKLIGERLKLGESLEVVLRRSCKNYPYPEFLFFTVTIRANVARGGQLKVVLARLIRVLVDARTLDKKKMAMTSEARISAKIVAAIPLIFMIILNYVNPENVDFILYDPEGRLVLFYVLGSELLGLLIVWLLVRGVRA